MAQGQIQVRKDGELRDVEDISLSVGSVQSIQARFNGELFEVWPPDDGDGFEVTITDARVTEDANFDVTITDSRAVDSE